MADLFYIRWFYSKPLLNPMIPSYVLSGFAPNKLPYLINRHHPLLSQLKELKFILFSDHTTKCCISLSSLTSCYFFRLQSGLPPSPPSITVGFCYSINILLQAIIFCSCSCFTHSLYCHRNHFLNKLACPSILEAKSVLLDFASVSSISCHWEALPNALLIPPKPPLWHQITRRYPRPSLRPYT
jgi:hypothetical protein